jgi:hypothetical protein
LRLWFRSEIRVQENVHVREKDCPSRCPEGRAAILGRAEAAAGPVDPNEPQAKSLGYVKDATKVDAKANPNFKPGQHCANCLQVPKGKEGGAQVPCNIFAGRLVEAKGWCKVWVKRP